MAVDRIEGLLRLFSLHGSRHAAIAAYSKGMRQKVLLSAALMHNPDLLLLDEPFSGLDVGTGLVLRSLIQELASRGKAVLFSSHELETVEHVCSHVVILNRGKIVADDSIERLRTLMAVPTLEGIFSQLAVEQDTAAISREIAGPDLRMSGTGDTRFQFRVLRRQFLFRVVDVEVLSTHALGDASKLLGQFVALLLFVSLLLSLGLLGFNDANMTPDARLALSASMEHFLVATTMLVVGIFGGPQSGFEFSRPSGCF